MPPTKRRSRSRSPARQPPDAAHETASSAPVRARAAAAPRASILLDGKGLALCAASVLGCLLFYAFGELVGTTLYEAMSSSLVCTTVPVAYTRMMVGSERLVIRATHAVGLALLSLWLFSSPPGEFCAWYQHDCP